MPRGKKNPDPGLVSDVNLLSFRSTLERIANGGESSITIMQIARLCEGVMQQNRSNLPKNSIGPLDSIVRRGIEQALIMSSQLRGETDLLEDIFQFEQISQKHADWHRMRIAYISRYFTAKMAQIALGVFDTVEEKLESRGSGAGRKAGRFGPQIEIDGPILAEALRRLPSEQHNVDDIRLAIRRVVADAIQGGRLPALGHPDTPKEAVDGHTKRIVRYWRRLNRTSPK